MIDPISVPILYLKPLLGGVTVAPDLIGYSPGQKWVEVSLVDMAEEVEYREFSATYAFYAYGPDKKSTVSLVIDVWDKVLHGMRNQTINGAYINDVLNDKGPMDNSDETTGEQRYLFIATIVYT